MLDADFPADNGLQTQNLRYRLLLSGAGNGPTNLFGWNVPLTQDSLWDIGIGENYPAFFIDTEGDLDTDGDATITIDLAPGLTGGLVGGTLHFSVRQYQLTGFGPTHIHRPSQAVSIDSLP